MTDRRTALRAALQPASIAVIGASENPDKIGGRPLFYLSKFGYKGKVYPINPNRSKAQAYKAYPSLDALPEAPEVAIIAVPGDMAVEAVDACAARGVKVALVMTSGFGETADPDAQAKQRSMVERARAAGMCMIGPNTQGLANFGNGAVLNFSTMFIESDPKDGPVGVISQSGAMSVVPYGLLRAQGIGVRHVHATGNDADVTVSELASVVAEDPDLRLLLLYLETIRDPWNLAQCARIAHARGLPIIALKSGRTPAGQQAAKSHTGALANEDRVVDAFLEQHGIWRARDVGELTRAAELYLKGWKPKGRRLVAISNSGAICVMAADTATSLGMPMAQLGADTRAGLAKILPSFATTTNPIDITAALLTNSGLFGQILPVIAKDAAADAFLIGIPVAGQGYDVDGFAADTAVFARRTGKPLVTAIPQPRIGAKFKAQGLAVFATESEAVAALDQYLSHIQMLGRVRPPPAAVPARRTPEGRKLRTLNEADSLELLSRYGVPVMRHRLCRTPDEAVAALQEIGAPVVVKACSSAMPHKSEWGLVKLDVHTEEQVRSLHGDFDRTLRLANAPFEGMIVGEMVRGRRELMIGAHVDPVFGPVVVVGDGGKYVEAMPDLRLLVPPFDELDVVRALSRLRIAPLLPGVRGDPPLASETFAEIAVAVARMMLDPGCEAVSVDLNPVMVGAPGEPCKVVDALVEIAG
jgi:acyl-CoA synthetase (NDP forming)